jgi:hypothetical protein
MKNVIKCAFNFRGDVIRGRYIKRNPMPMAYNSMINVRNLSSLNHLSY